MPILPPPESHNNLIPAGHKNAIQQAAAQAADMTRRREAISHSTGNAVALRDLSKAIFQTYGRIPGVPSHEFVQLPGTLLFRGVSHFRHVRSNINGEWFGTGFLGDGNHYADGSARDDAIEDYGFSRTFGWATAYKLSPDARIIPAHQAEQVSFDEYAQIATGLFGIETNILHVLYHETYDNSFRSILTGHDAMVEPETGYYVVYNHLKLVHNSDLTPWALGLEPN